MLTFDRIPCHDLSGWNAILNKFLGICFCLFDFLCLKVFCAFYLTIRYPKLRNSLKFSLKFERVYRNLLLDVQEMLLYTNKNGPMTIYLRTPLQPRIQEPAIQFVKRRKRSNIEESTFPRKMQLSKLSMKYHWLE